MTYRAILFDLGRVLIHFDFQRGYRALEGLCPYKAEEIPKQLAGTNLVRDFETGLIEPHDFVARMAERLGFRLSYEQFCGIWSSIFTETLVPESLIEELHQRYRMVVLSNTNHIHFEMVRQAYPLLRHFDAFVLSHEVKAMKPEPAIFRAAIEAAQCRAEECFYTDDIAEYVEGARKLGIDAEQFQGAAKLMADLRKRGMIRA